MAVITISRESGARGSYIGRKLAERLGYLFVDREAIHEVSLEYGVRQDEFQRIYEQAPGLLEQYVQRNREIVQLIGRIIEGLASRDNVVIVARDGFAVLREYGDVLNVRVTAMHKVRLQRIQQDHNLSQRKQTRTLLDRLDSERSKYIGAYYGLNWADAALYDLSLNTSKLEVEPLVELTVQAIKILEQYRDLDRPLVREIEVDPVLERAINEALSLLEATGRIA